MISTVRIMHLTDQEVLSILQRQCKAFVTAVVAYPPESSRSIPVVTLQTQKSPLLPFVFPAVIRFVV
jgi:hypothetical protein